MATAEFSKFAGILSAALFIIKKINTRNLETEVLKTVQDLYTENYETLPGEIKNDVNGGIYHNCGLEDQLLGVSPPLIYLSSNKL